MRSDDIDSEKVGRANPAGCKRWISLLSTLWLATILIVFLFVRVLNSHLGSSLVAKWGSR